jgi:hypothetical protein
MDNCDIKWYVYPYRDVLDKANLSLRRGRKATGVE